MSVQPKSRSGFPQKGGMDDSNQVNLRKRSRIEQKKREKNMHIHYAMILTRAPLCSLLENAAFYI
jgi:hypothetical protein